MHVFFIIIAQWGELGGILTVHEVDGLGEETFPDAFNTFCVLKYMPLKYVTLIHNIKKKKTLGHYS